MAQAESAVPVHGKMFLYSQPELLTREDHGTLGFTPRERPYEYVRNERAIPLTMSEFAEAQRHYPIVFSSLDKPVPLAVTAILDDRNLFVDDAGNWDPMCYVPGYLRRYPFALSAEVEGKHVLVVDRAAAVVTEDPTYPFFVDGEMSEQTRALMEYCTNYEGDRMRTRETCGRLRELGLLVSQRATHQPEGIGTPQTLAEYICVDQQKMNDLDADTVFELYKSGALSAVFMHLASLQNWRHLVARRVAAGRGRNPAASGKDGAAV